MIRGGGRRCARQRSASNVIEKKENPPVTWPTPTHGLKFCTPLGFTCSVTVSVDFRLKAVTSRVLAFILWRTDYLNSLIRSYIGIYKRCRDVVGFLQFRLNLNLIVDSLTMAIAWQCENNHSHSDYSFKKKNRSINLKSKIQLRNAFFRW